MPQTDRCWADKRKVADCHCLEVLFYSEAVLDALKFIDIATRSSDKYGVGDSLTLYSSEAIIVPHQII